MLYTTVADMMRQLRRKLDEPFPSQFSDTTLYRFIREASEVISPRVGAVTGTISFQTVANQPSYDLANLSDPVTGIRADHALWFYTGVVRDAAETFQSDLIFYSWDYANSALGLQIGNPDAPVGRPEIGVVAGEDYRANRRLFLYPVPDRVYSVTLPFLGVTLGDDAALEPRLATALRDVAVELAFTYCLDRRGRIQEAEALRRRIDRRISEIGYFMRVQGSSGDKLVDADIFDRLHI